MKKYFLILLLFCHGAFAKDSPKNFKVKSRSTLALEFALDNNYDARDNRGEFLDTGFRSRFRNILEFSHGIALNTNILVNRFDNIDQTQRRNAETRGSDRSFENIGAVLREFNISKQGKSYKVAAGKFNLNFGSAWRWDRGIWIQQLAQDNYRQVEKLGLLGSYRLGDIAKTGEYNFTFSGFTNDRKNFDNSILVNRNSDKKSDARSGDGRSLDSYVAMIDVNFKFSEREKLSYQFSYLSLAANNRNPSIAGGKIATQKDLVLNIDYHYPINDNVVLNTFIEYVDVKNLNGNSDFAEKYLTANFITKFNNGFSILLGNSRRQNFQFGANGFDQNLIEASLGYEFSKNSFFDRLTIQAGYKQFRNDNRTIIDNQNAVGFLMRYYKYF